MIASSSPALRASPMITSSYHVTAAAVSPDGSHTEASLSPIATQSPSAMDTSTTSMLTSSVVNGNCEPLLSPVKIQNNSDQLPAFPAAAASNTMAGLVQSQTNQFIPPYLPPQYGSVVVEGMKTETPIQAQQAMSYQSLQAVSSDHHGFSQLINVSQTSTLPPIPFLTNLSTQAPQSNGGMTQNGVSTTQVFSASPENASKSFFVQMENGSYQVRFDGLAGVESVKNQTRIHEIPSSISPPVTDSACECNNVTFLG